jgi:ubiquinone/menaquinone biosynthesis C-methylase UbiE
MEGSSTVHEPEQAKLVRTHFDRMSDVWGDFYTRDLTFANYNFLIRKRHVLDLFDKKRGRFLDAGCGTGDFLPDLAARGGDVYALDFASEMIDKARERMEQAAPGSPIQFYVGDVTSLPFESNFFDAIIGVGLVEYLADLDAGLREMHRVLKPGGIFIVTVPNITSPFMAYETVVPKAKGLVKQALSAAGLRPVERSYLQRHFVPWQFDRQLTNIGYRKVDSSFCTYGLFSSPRLEGLSLKLSNKLDRFGHSALGHLGTNYIVKVEKL